MSNKIVRTSLREKDSGPFYLTNDITFELTKSGERVLSDFIVEAIGELGIDEGFSVLECREKMLNKYIDNKTGKYRMKLHQFMMIFGPYLYRNVGSPLIKDNQFYMKGRM